MKKNAFVTGCFFYLTWVCCACAQNIALYRDFKKSSTSCLCNYVVFLNSNNQPRRAVVDLGSPNIFLASGAFKQQCKGRKLETFQFGTPPSFQYCKMKKPVDILRHSANYLPLANKPLEYGLASYLLKKPLRASGVIGLAVKSDQTQYILPSVVMQLGLHRFSLVFPESATTPGALVLGPLPSASAHGPSVWLQLIHPRQSALGHYLFHVHTMAFQLSSHRKVLLKNTSHGLLYIDNQHPKGVRVASSLEALIDNGVANFPVFLRLDVSLASKKRAVTFFQPQGPSPQSVSIVVEDVHHALRTVTCRVPSSERWAFHSPTAKPFLQQGSRNIPYAAILALPFIEHFNLDFSLNKHYTAGFVKLVAKDAFCHVR